MHIDRVYTNGAFQTIKAMLSLVLVSSLLISHVLSQAQQPGCTETPQALITGDRFRVEDDQFSASSSYSDSYLPQDARITRGSWCSANLGPSAEHWVQVDFGANVIIHELRTGGYNGVVFGIGATHLTQFQVQFGSNSLQLMPIRDSSNEVMTFTRPDTHAVRDVSLPVPILTRVLRIVSIAHTGSVPCITVEALGSVQSPACQTDELLSTNRSLLPLSSITASSAMSDNPAQHVVDDSRTGWCTAEQFSEGNPMPYIIFNFTERVELTYMMASGAPFAYVTEFSLDFRGESFEDFTPYTLLTQEEAEFTGGSTLQTYTFWKQPLVGTTFRFKVQDGQRQVFNRDFCWNVQLFGCTAAEQATMVPPLTLATSPQSSAGTQVILPTTTVTMTTATSPNFSVAFQRGVVGGAVSGAIVLVLLLLLLLIAILIIILVVKHRAKKVRLAEVKYTESGEVRVVHNEIYGQDSLITDYKKGATLTVNNMMHDSIRSPANSATALADANIYESIGSPHIHTEHAAMGTVPEGSKSRMLDESLQTEDTSTEEQKDAPMADRMVDNPAYAATKSAMEENANNLIYNPIYYSTRLANVI